MVALDSEGKLTRSEVASFLHEFADELEDDHAGGPPEERRTFEDRPDVIGDESVDTDHDQRGEVDAQAEAADTKRITLIVGGDSATVSVPEVVEFDDEVASRSPMLSSNVNQAIEFDMSWKIDDPDDLDEEWLEVE